MDRPRGGVDLLSRIRIVERTGSTNADLLADTAAVDGEWLVALEQAAGRGRQGREWVGVSGNFFGSTLVELAPGDPAPATLSLAAGLALIEAVELVAPGRSLLLKWPNDLLLAGDKLGGVLLERSGNRIVCGFGVNLTAAPQLEGRRAASLDGEVAPQAFAPLLAGAFARQLRSWREATPDALPEAWLERAHPVGTRLAVHGGSGEPLSGSFAGIALDGALRLRLDDGSMQIVRAGDVEL